MRRSRRPEWRLEAHSAQRGCGLVPGSPGAGWAVGPVGRVDVLEQYNSVDHYCLTQIVETQRVET